MKRSPNGAPSATSPPQESVPKDVLERILGAGLKAPSHDHARDWHFVVMRDEQRILETLAAVGRKAQVQLEFVRRWTTATAEQREMYFDAVPKQMKMPAQSKCLVLPLFKAPENLLNPKRLTDLNSFASIWAVTENILLAATAEGVSCATRIPVYDEEDFVLGKVAAPSGHRMPCYLAFDYAAPNAPVLRQTDCPIEERVHYNAMNDRD